MNLSIYTCAPASPLRLTIATTRRRLLCWRRHCCDCPTLPRLCPTDDWLGTADERSTRTHSLAWLHARCEPEFRATWRRATSGHEAIDGLRRRPHLGKSRRADERENQEPLPLSRIPAAETFVEDLSRKEGSTDPAADIPSGPTRIRLLRSISYFLRACINIHGEHRQCVFYVCIRCRYLNPTHTDLNPTHTEALALEHTGTCCGP